MPRRHDIDQTVKPSEQNPVPFVLAIEPKIPGLLSQFANGAVEGCWNRIGVFGDGSCAELLNSIHCRNCLVYSAAGLALLDRKPPANYRADWAEHFTGEKNRGAPGPNSAVIFRLGYEWFALPTRVFQEVIESRTIHSLPDRRRGIVLGLINVRGELLICVSLARLLGIRESPISDHAPARQYRLVVAEWKESQIVFPVDEICGMHRYHAHELKLPPAIVGQEGTNFINGLLTWREKMISSLDEESLFSTLNRSLS